MKIGGGWSEEGAEGKRTINIWEEAQTTRTDTIGYG